VLFIVRSAICTVCQSVAVERVRARVVVQEGLAKVTEAQAGARCRRKLDRSLDDFDCILCCKLLFRPVTTPCGHSFCQCCFARAMDHCNRCAPTLRRTHHAGQRANVFLAPRT
jgi:Zinc finger, C3HC4 type (RING finger)